MSIQNRLGATLIVVFAFASCACAEDDPRPLVKRILADWKKRQDGLQSVSVEISGSQFWPKGSFDDDYIYQTEPKGKEALAKLGHIPPMDERHPAQIKFLFQFDNNWARKERHSMVITHPEAIFVPEQRTHLFDGEQIRVYTPRESNTSSAYTPSKEQPDLWIQTDSFEAAFNGNEDNPVFWGCGIIWVSATRLKKLKFPIDERNYLFEGFGEIGGRRHVVLRSPNLQPGNEVRYEFWVDPDRGSTISRSRYIQDGKLRFQIDADWDQHSGRWFPTKWAYSSNIPGRQPPKLETSFDYKVDRVVFNPRVERSDFDVKLKPNMVVYDVKEDSRGVIGPDSKSLLPLSAQNDVRRGLVFRQVAYWTCGVVLLLVIFWTVRRARISRTRA